MGIISWLFSKQRKRQDERLVQDTEYENISNLTDILHFNIEQADTAELKQCHLGDSVKLWTPDYFGLIRDTGNNSDWIYVFRPGTSMGNGRIGIVPSKYSAIIYSQVKKGLEYETEIVELSDNTCKIACRFISEEKTEAKKAKQVDDLEIELTKPYKPLKPIELDIYVNRKIKINIGDKLKIIFDELETYVLYPYAWEIHFVDEENNIIPKNFLDSLERAKGKRILKAHFNSYAFDVEVVSLSKIKTKTGLKDHHTLNSHPVKLILKPYKIK